MPNLNKVMLIGNLTRDPEVKFTQSGKAVGNCGIAINRTYKDSAGQPKEDTTFVDIELWGRTAEVAAQYAKKGHPIFVEGRLSLDSWEDKQTGQKRSRLKVVAEGIQLLGSKPSERQAEPAEPGAFAALRGKFQKPQEAAALPPADDDDIPF